MAAPADACRPCHAERVALQEKTPHANALRPWTGEHFAGRTLRDRSGTEYAFDVRTVRISRNGEQIELPVKWAFGSGEQAITPVIEREGRPVESRISWYRQGNRLGLTPGHDPTPPLELADHLGIEQTARNEQRCFGCHTTAGEPGVSCQSCHGAAIEHRLAPGPKNVKRDRTVALCASCHRAPDETFQSAMPELDDARTIRFAPVGFMASACFQRSRDFTCITCHDPHGAQRLRPVNNVCADCHRKTHVGQRRSDCVACHMKSGSPMPNLTFTDHRIRVYPD